MIDRPNGQSEVHAGDDEGLGEFADVLGPLQRMTQAINRARYPGRAWQGAAQASGRRLIFRLMPALAAAAAILIVAAGAYWALFIRPTTPPTPLQGPGPVAVVTQPATGEEGDAQDDEPVVYFDPSIAAQVTWTMPAITMPSLADPNGAGWTLPRFSFPSFGTLQDDGEPPTTTRPDDSTG